MPVSRDDFHVAIGMFTSLQPLATDREGRITAISVTIGGTLGSGRRSNVSGAAAATAATIATSL